MAAKLKSTLKQVRWSLVLRAAFFALSWFVAPFWFFVLVALYLYFVPWFQAGKFVVPFFMLMILAFLEPTGFLFALILGVIFYFLLFIKDLLVIDRRSAYELIVIALTFFILRDFFVRFQNGFGGAAIWYTLLPAAAIGLLVHSFIKCFAEGSHALSRKYPAGLLATVITWQFLILGLFLPLDFIYQSTIIFLATVLIIDLIPEYCLEGSVSRQKVLVASSTIFVLLVLMLGSARWTL